MPNKEVSAALAIARLIRVVDDARPDGSSFRLPAELRAVHDAARAALETGDVSATEEEGERAGSSAAARAVYTTLLRLVRTGHSGIVAIPSADLIPGGITPAQRLEVFTTYGWDRGELGRFPDARVRTLAELAVRAGGAVDKPAWRYAADLVTAIQAQLALLDGLEPKATTGGRQAAVGERDERLDEMENANSRVRHYYCSASRDLDKTPELARIGFQPRRDAGEVDYAPAAPPPAAGGAPLPAGGAPAPKP